MGMVEALHYLREEVVARLVAAGRPLSTALQESGLFKDIFSIELIAAGKKSGQLVRSLEYVLHSLEKQKTLQSQLISALIYPVIIMVGTISVSLGLIIFIFPKILPIFTSMNLKLPWTTSLLIDLVYVCQHYFWSLIILSLIIVCALWYFFKFNEKFQTTLSLFILKFPLSGNLYRTYFSAQFCKIFCLLLFAGLSVPESLFCAQKMWSKGALNLVLVKISRQVEEGKTLSFGFKEFSYIFPKLLTELIGSGERSGNLAEAFEYLSEYYELELGNVLKTLSVLIEPALMIFLGLGIGFISMSLITPIYSLTNHING